MPSVTPSGLTCLPVLVYLSIESLRTLSRTGLDGVLLELPSIKKCPSPCRLSVMAYECDLYDYRSVDGLSSDLETMRTAIAMSVVRLR